MKTDDSTEEVHTLYDTHVSDKTAIAGLTEWCRHCVV